ncbi:MAG: glycosyltransferase family 2 protein [Terriglobia bacterium]
MKIAEYIFWSCLVLIAYSYFLYPVLLFLGYSFAQVARDWEYLIARQDRRTGRLSSEELPAISLVFPAYNEEAHLLEKIANTRGLDYPKDRLEVLIVSDGSTDRTNEILNNLHDTNIRAVLLPERKGKYNALNQAVKMVSNDLLVFCDATTLFAPPAVMNLIRHFQDPRTGIVAGALQFRGSDEFHQTEGVYWKYESVLRMMEARLGLALSASGAIYALRRQCYRTLTADDVIEDCLIPMYARRLGYRVLYDPEAMGYEIPPSSVEGEFTRKVRFAVGGFRSLGVLTQSAFGSSLGMALAFISHKLLRWVVPFLLVGLLASDVFLLGSASYRGFFVAQVLFYSWAGLGFVFRDRVQKVRFALLGYYLVAMNVALALGFLRFLAGREETLWQRAA